MVTPPILGFIYPQEGIACKKSGGYDHIPYLRSVDIVEVPIGIDFLSILRTILRREFRG